MRLVSRIGAGRIVVSFSAGDRYANPITNVVSIGQATACFILGTADTERRTLETGMIMAKRKKPATLQKRKSATRKTTRTSRRGKPAKRTVAKRMPKKVKAKVKRAGMKKTARKKAAPIKPPSAPEVETVIVDVVEEPVPGVITVTEFEETEVREPSANPEWPEED